MTSVVELLRVSTTSQAGEDRTGLPAQHATNLRTAVLHQLTITETVEIVESGTTVAESPQMRAVLDLVTAGRVKGIVLAEYSRLFRPDRWSDLFVLQTLSDHDARIYLPSGPIDLQTEIGFVQATVNNLLAAMERRRIRERMHRGKEEHRRRGEHMGGGIGLPLGLTWSRERGWEYTPEIERVREAFRLFLAGEPSIKAIADKVGLSRTSCAYILKNPIYSGWKVWDEKRDTSPGGRYPGGDRRRIPRGPDEVIRVRLPLLPVVSEQDFALVQHLISVKPRVARKSLAHRFLYRGYVNCSCGQPIYGGMGGYGNGTAYYLCKSRLKTRAVTERCGTGYTQTKVLDAALDRAIVGQLLDPDVIGQAVADYNEAAGEFLTSKNTVHRPNQDRKRARVIEAFVDGVIDRAERDRRLAALEPLPQPEPRPRADAAVVQALVNVLADWQWYDAATKRRALAGLGPTFVAQGPEVLGVHLPLLSGQPLSDGWRRRDSLWVPLAA